ncbi:MAG TPA: hypothetical protein VF129_08095, partial [Actinomycetota bacterium]
MADKRGLLGAQTEPSDAESSLGPGRDEREAYEENWYRSLRALAERQEHLQDEERDEIESDGQVVDGIQDAATAEPVDSPAFEAVDDPLQAPVTEPEPEGSPGEPGPEAGIASAFHEAPEPEAAVNEVGTEAGVDAEMPPAPMVPEVPGGTQDEPDAEEIGEPDVVAREEPSEEDHDTSVGERAEAQPFVDPADELRDLEPV